MLRKVEEIGRRPVHAGSRVAPRRVGFINTIALLSAKQVTMTLLNYLKRHISNKSIPSKMSKSTAFKALLKFNKVKVVTFSSSMPNLISSVF